MTSRHKSCEARLLFTLVAQPCCLAYTRTSPMWSTARGGKLANHSQRPSGEPAVGNLQISRGTSDLQALRHVMARATREQLPNGATQGKLKQVGKLFSLKSVVRNPRMLISSLSLSSYCCILTCVTTISCQFAKRASGVAY